MKSAYIFEYYIHHDEQVLQDPYTHTHTYAVWNEFTTKKKSESTLSKTSMKKLQFCNLHYNVQNTRKCKNRKQSNFHRRIKLSKWCRQTSFSDSKSVTYGYTESLQCICVSLSLSPNEWLTNRCKVLIFLFPFLSLSLSLSYRHRHLTCFTLRLFGKKTRVHYFP